MYINLKIKKNPTENKQDKWINKSTLLQPLNELPQIQITLKIEMNKTTIMYLFSLDRLKGQTSKLWQIQSYFWLLFKGDFL
jgi:hypothetical protein